VNRDFRDLFAALNDAGADYLLVGGYAVAIHASPRYTKDLDVWIRPKRENAERVMRALDDFGSPKSDLTIDDLSREGTVFVMGVEPSRIDLLTSIDGVSFDQAWPNRLTSDYADVKVQVIGKGDLIRNKEASARPQDLADVAALRAKS
jgi:hypothetical protein